MVHRRCSSGCFGEMSEETLELRSDFSPTGRCKPEVNMEGLMYASGTNNVVCGYEDT